jgi:hypothetical protein
LNRLDLGNRENYENMAEIVNISCIGFSIAKLPKSAQGDSQKLQIWQFCTENGYK